MSFLITNSNRHIYNNSIINNIFSQQSIQVTCRSVFGSSNLKFRSDNEMLNTFFNAEDYNNPTQLDEATITVQNVSDYEIELIIDDSFIDGNITCYSEESGEFATILITSGMYNLRTSILYLLT